MTNIYQGEYLVVTHKNTSKYYLLLQIISDNKLLCRFIYKKGGISLRITALFFITLFYMIGLFVQASVVIADCINNISVHYNERVPYLQTTPQGVKGITADPTNLAFEKAGIPFQWKRTPSKRQITILKMNKGCDCLVGWFKNPEREKFAQYTHHIYQDKPQVALTRADNKKLKNGVSIDNIFSNRALKLLVKDGYSYGGFLDKKISQNNPNLTKVIYENMKMLELIFNNRYDYFFISPEEAVGLIESSGISNKNFKYVTFSDMPKGEKRYIICSQKVGD